MSSVTLNSKHNSKCSGKRMHHIIAHKQASTVDTIFYPGETREGENPNNLSYEDSFIIRTSIHHDHGHQPFHK